MPRAVSARSPAIEAQIGTALPRRRAIRAARIVEALGDVSQSTVLEIGPGRGILTSLLAKRARRLIAVELDRVLAAQLRLKFGMYRNVEIIEARRTGHRLRLAVRAQAWAGPSRHRTQAEPVKVVGNLPYYITSDILLRLFKFCKYFDSHGHHGAARSCRPDRRRSRRPRIWLAFRHRTTLRPRRKALHRCLRAHSRRRRKCISAVLRLTMDPQQEKLGVAGDGFIDF